MTLEIKRLHLASLQGLDGGTWPVHGFVVTHPGGAVLVDTGAGGPREVLDDWRGVSRSVADALAELDMSPADIGLVINTYLHFDHCGQNAVFKHAPPVTPKGTSAWSCAVTRRVLTCSSATPPARRGSTPTRIVTGSRPVRPATCRRGAIRYAGSSHCTPTACTSAITPASSAAD